MSNPLLSAPRALFLACATTLGLSAFAPWSSDSQGPHEVWLAVDSSSEQELEFIGKGDTIRFSNHGDEAQDYQVLNYDDGALWHELKVLAGESVDLPIDGDKSVHRAGITDNGIEDEDEIDSVCDFDCLAGNVPVWTDSGAVAAQTLESEPDSARRFDPTGSPFEVSSGTAHALIELTLPGETLLVSRGHDFRLEAGAWIEASELRPGDRLAARDSEGRARSARVTAVRPVEPAKPQAVFNVRLPGNEPYLIGGARLVTRGTDAR